MENSVLKKRLNTFRTAKGTLRGLSDELLIDILRAWEAWPGSSREFYQELGLSKTQLAVLMKKAKRLCREGHHPEAGEFKEIALSAIPQLPSSGGPCLGIELCWEQGKLIRFTMVEQLVEFLKKAA